MREHVVTVSSRGRITVPVAIRRELGIRTGDQVAFAIDDVDSAMFRRVEHDFRSFQGVIPTPPGLVTDDFDDLIEEAMSDHADWVVQRMHDGLE